MKPLVTQIAAQAAKLTLTCIVALVAIVLTLFLLNWHKHYKGFSSPSSNDPAPVSLAGPGRIMSTLELQRELNRRDPKLKLAVDGVYGPATKAAHERACGDQYATELMVWGVK